MLECSLGYFFTSYPELHFAVSMLSCAWTVSFADTWANPILQCGLENRHTIN